MSKVVDSTDMCDFCQQDAEVKITYSRVKTGEILSCFDLCLRCFKRGDGIVELDELDLQIITGETKEQIELFTKESK